jgi:ABC-2 type transport system ATP-binding protein
VLEDGRTVAVTVQEPGRAVLDVVRALDSAALVPEWLTIREPSLDDVFLQLTGHKAEAADGAGAPAAAAGRGRKRGAA